MYLVHGKWTHFCGEKGEVCAHWPPASIICDTRSCLLEFLTFTHLHKIGLKCIKWWIPDLLSCRCVTDRWIYVFNVKKGRIMASQRCPCPGSWKLWICYLTWQKGLSTCAIKLRTWRWGGYLGVCVCIQYNYRFLKAENLYHLGRKKIATLLILKVEEKGHEPNIMGISRSWKRNPCCRLQKGAVPWLRLLEQTLVRLMLNIWPTEA